MTDHPLSKIVEDFHLYSYHAGINTAFAEVVGAGCKKLALSATYEPDFANKMMAATEHAAKEYNVLLHVEENLLVTKLFPADVAKDKVVIMILQNQEVLYEYLTLKEIKKKSNSEGNPDEMEVEIARQFGKLLSYDDASIERLLSKNG